MDLITQNCKQYKKEPFVSFQQKEELENSIKIQ